MTNETAVETISPEGAQYTRTFELGIYDIVIELTYSEFADPGKPEGTISSNFSDVYGSTLVTNMAQVEAALDTIENTALLHACLGIDVLAAPYVEGLQTAIENVQDAYSGS